MDYNQYFQKLNIRIKSHLSLKDLLTELETRLDDFVYDRDFLNLRINGVVVFENISISEIYTHFGQSLELTPISIKYAMKDLLIDKEAIFARYKERLDNFGFLSEECKLEFKKYIHINLISPLEMEDYVGDGYCLYIKWMMLHYKNNAKELLDSISKPKDGVMNSIHISHLIYPQDTSIDTEIEALQRLLLTSNHSIWGKFANKIESSFSQRQ